MLKKIGFFGFFLATLMLLAGHFQGQSQETDSILSYYRQRAAQAYDSRSPYLSGINFSFRATTYYMNIGEHGEVTRLDSGITDYYYSFGELDSSKVILKPEKAQKPPELESFNVFASDYLFHFYPNDTGGAELAIGFDTYREDDSLPVGLAVIDRNRYFLRWLYLHFPNKKYHKRFSRSFRFVEHEKYIFPDSVWQVSARRGVFTTEFFRTETGISSITVYR